MKKSPGIQRTPGRPSTFDREAALAKATRLFWQRGYEATSIADLSRELEASPPTLYAAFGSKQQLYREALGHYAGHDGAVHLAAFAQVGSARTCLARFLRQIAHGFAAPSRPRGCMVSVGALQGREPAIAEATAALRAATTAMFRQRFEQAQHEGELPADSDPDALARFYATVTQGMAVQARDGVAAEALEAVAEIALAAWPGT